MIVQSFGGLDLEKLNVSSFWVVPDAGSFMFSLINSKQEDVVFLITQFVDLEDYIEDQIPGRIYTDEQLLALNSPEEKDLLLVLRTLIQKQLIGHPQGLAVLIVTGILDFFESGNAIELDKKLNSKA